jgi:hypothetical protein
LAALSALYGGDEAGPILRAIRVEAAVVAGAVGAFLGSLPGLAKG